MLIRATPGRTRQQRRRLALKSYDQLLLPWLCPAVSKQSRQHGRRTSTTSRPASPRSAAQARRSVEGRIPNRQLGTAADSPSTDVSQQFLPFVDLPVGEQHRASQRSGEPSLASLKGFQRDNLIILPATTHTASPIFRTMRMSGVTGDMDQLQENIYACLKVGSLDRAAQLTRQFIIYMDPADPKVLDANRQYLMRLLDALIAEPTKEHLVKMQKWLELDMRAKGVPLDGSFVAIILKACLFTLRGAKLERKVRHYMKYAEELGEMVKEDTLASNLFSEGEVSKILRMFPQQYSTPPEIITEEDFTMQSPRAAHFRHNAISTSELDATKEAPSLEPVQQKGLGLVTLKKSLAAMISDKPSSPMAEYDADPLYARQARLEQNVLSAALERWRDESTVTQEMRQMGSLQDPLLGSYVHEWVSEMVPLVEEEIKKSEMTSGKKGTIEQLDHLLLGPFLKMMSPEKICAATVLAFITSIIDNETRKEDINARKMLKITHVVSHIGSAIQKEFGAEAIHNDFLYKYGSLPSTERRQKLAQLTKRSPAGFTSSRAAKNNDVVMSDSLLDSEARAGFQMSPDLRIKLGALLMSLFMKVAKLPATATNQKTGQTVTQLQPVASHGWKFAAGKRYGVINTNMQLVNRLKKEPVAGFIAKYMPMVIEPRDWKGLYDGAYLTSKVEAVRFKDSSFSQKDYLRIADARGDLKQVYKGMDVIGKVPWTVNRSLFEVMSQVWNTGEELAKFAPAEPEQKYPPEPDQADRKAHARWLSIIKRIDNENTAHHSQRCYQNFQLEVARTYLSFTFYCPHNIDFRGRAYPIPPYFNHMGSDYVRALFLFAKGKKLGDEGVRWLKIHLSNSYGFTKESLKDRESFADEHLSDVFDSVERPLEGRRWWLSAEDPWQCLAACMELKNALDSPVPSQYVSHLPIQQDGSCNGLQHYAALGGDEIGAEQVNLAPSDKPADIYSAVAELVKRDVEKDAAAGHKQAKVLYGNVTRKIVKQPVMTNVYGVTFHGAAAQVKRQLVNVLPKASLDNDINLGKVSTYTASLIFKALGEMFHGAHAIQEWLGVCGGRISQAITPEQMQRVKERRDKIEEPKGAKSERMVKAQKRSKTVEDYQFKSTIVWTTPLGMPVVQPYRETNLHLIKTNLQNIAAQKSTESDPVSKRKQLQGFPPNFIHSLDATHMMLSAIKCDELGLTFSAVHDSFWTHACDLPTMNRVLRDAFVRMHSEDIIARLREEFIARYSGCLHWASIKLSSGLGQKILTVQMQKGYYKTQFSRPAVNSERQIDTLMEEYERMQLLQSDDPAERERGKNMVTPASLYESEQDVEALIVEEKVPTLGDMTKSTRGTKYNTDEVDPSEDNVDPEATDEAMVEDGDTEESDETKKASRKKRNNAERIYFWMPLEFPPAPKKGSFDVSRLKDSQYFFS